MPVLGDHPWIICYPVGHLKHLPAEFRSIIEQKSAQIEGVAPDQGTHSRRAASNDDYVIVHIKRDYEKNENNKINERPKNFRLFRYFRFFRNLSSIQLFDQFPHRPGHRRLKLHFNSSRRVTKSEAESM